MNLFKEARKFLINQRLKELQQSIQHWPNSDNNPKRFTEIKEKEAELKAIDEEK